jgi:hypothetical protein
MIYPLWFIHENLRNYNNFLQFAELRFGERERIWNFSMSGRRPLDARK